MANARLLSLTIERFKSYEAPPGVNFAPLTVQDMRREPGARSSGGTVALARHLVDEERFEAFIIAHELLHLHADARALVQGAYERAHPWLA